LKQYAATAVASAAQEMNLTQSAFSAILQVFPLPAVFVVAGAGMLTASWFTRYIPKRY